MAILHQRAIAINFQISGSRLVVDSYRAPAVTNRLADVTMPPLRDDLNAADSQETKTASGPGMNIRIERQLDQVIIAEMKQSQLDAIDQDAVVVYESNGRCTPYHVRLADENDASIEINVDALGSAEIVRGEHP
jgi:hypothetical protein